MYAARLKRRTPYVDKTVYTGWNGMCISAYIAAGRALGLREPVEFALKSLDRVLREVWSDAGLAHVVAYGEGVAPERAVPGVLDDYAFVANAALDAWEASGEMRYFDAAQQIADAMLKRFYDVTGCGFFDTELNSTEERIGALAARRKPLQDSPTPAGKCSCGDGVAAARGVDEQQRLRDARAGDARDLCRCGRTFRVVRRELRAGAAQDDRAAATGMRRR